MHLQVMNRPKNEIDLVEYLERDKLEIMDNWPKFGYTLLTHVANMLNFR